MDSLGAVKLEERKRQFMSGVDIEGQRVRREQFAVDLRKQKRIESATKRRLLSTSKYSTQFADGPENLSLEGITDLLLDRFPALRDQTLSEVSRAAILKDILMTAQPQDVVTDVVTVIRRTLSKDCNPPVRALMSVGVIPALMPYVNPLAFPKNIVFEATWAVCNLLSGPHEAAEAVLSAHGLPALLSLITPNDEEITEHAIWGLGNLAGDCAEYRDMLLAAGVHKAIQVLLQQRPAPGPTITRIAAWTLLCCLRPKQIPPVAVCEEILPLLYFLSQTDDVDTQKEVLWGLSHITDQSNELCSLVVKGGFVAFAIRSVRNDNPIVVTPAMRLLGNIASTDNEMTQVVLDFGLLDALLPLIDAPEFQIRKEVMWTLSNITAGNFAQLALFMGHSVCKEAMRGLSDPVYAVRREAAFIYSNIAKQGSSDSRLQLARTGLFEKLTERILAMEVDLIAQGLGIVESVLRAGEEAARYQGLQTNPAATLLESTDALSHLFKLQRHFNSDIAEKALSICDCFFGLDEKLAEMEECSKPPEQFSV